MKITIVGAGPVGLLTGCLLAMNGHTIIVLEKRLDNSSRNHLLNIDESTIDEIVRFAPGTELSNTIKTYRNTPVSTSDIQRDLLKIARSLNITIHIGINIINVDSISDNVIIAADGAHSTIRKEIFGDRLEDEMNVGYISQLKFKTPGATKPRSAIVASSHSLINGLSGDDIVLTFESMGPVSNVQSKSGTLHIPIPKSVYDILSGSSYTLESLRRYKSPSIQKLVRVINRYRLGVELRGGLLGGSVVSVLPLKVYRSPQSAVDYNSKKVYLVGDSSSGMVYQRGLNKGWKESLELSRIFSGTIPQDSMRMYNDYCVRLYNSEKTLVQKKSQKIESGNTSISVGGRIIGIGLLGILGLMLFSGASSSESVY